MVVSRPVLKGILWPEEIGWQEHVMNSGFLGLFLSINYGIYINDLDIPIIPWFWVGVLTPITIAILFNLLLVWLRRRKGIL